MEFKDKQSIYLQIADYISEQILLGKWPPGERIPSVREMAGMLEVNPNTVIRTYDFLQVRDIIFNKRGIGYSVNDEAIDRIKSYRKERFLTGELPDFFRTISLLQITMEEIQLLYKDFILNNTSTIN